MSLLQDLRYGARKLVHNPGFSALSVVTLALGIGLTTTMFSIVYGALLRGLPFEHGERVVAVRRANPPRDQKQMDLTPHDFDDYRAQQRSFEGLGAFSSGTMTVSGTEKPERFDGAYLTANTFQLIRAQPLLGRTFGPGEDAVGAPAVVVLGYAIWQNRYGGDRGIIGRTIRVNGEQAEVIGVMPKGFEFPSSEKLWLTLRNPLPAKRGDGDDLFTFGRLRPGVSMQQADTEVKGIARRLAAQYPESNKDITAYVEPYTRSFIGDEPTKLLGTMLFAVFLVLLIACANVANLLLSQAAMRAKEVGIRTAMGASRARVIMQFLTEPLAMAMIAAVLGTLMAVEGVKLFNAAIASTEPPFWIRIRIDGPILLFVLAITLFSTFVAGVLPAIRASGANVNEVLKDESRGSSSFRGGRLSRALVVFEIALSVGLLVAAGLTIKSVTRLRNMDYGFPTRTIFTARVGLPETVYRDSVAQVRFFDQLYQRLADLQGVESYTLTGMLPVLGGPTSTFAVEGKAYAQPRDYPETHFVNTYPGYFRTFQVQLEGRDFGSGDTRTSDPVAIVNRSFVKKYFGGASPVGRRFRFGDAKSTEPWRTIVGVVPDMWVDGTDNKKPESVYLPFAQAPQRYVSVVIRPRGTPPGAMTAPVRNLVASLDPDLPIYFVKTLQERIDDETWFYRVFGALFMIMGAVALVLAAVGLYGVMAFNVSRRTREMGVRMALGAKPRDVVRLIMRQGIIQLVIGLVLGLGLAYALGSLLTIILFQVSPIDAVTYGATLAVLALAALAASYIPARRATRVDPMVALRYE
ncbi:ABC transporter permease [Longimicrobium sp.]|uniref:ABC transporter permease n=1 Tax=Longimicrobium sp. TaxID=2029185 RepID=UPI002CAB3DAB|nr:ABC transporter permease [Longimicrobium sp.]HSU17880.1 ABC transporter permease [Longimicrobium sp.]